MTQEELRKVPFHCVGNLLMADGSNTAYSSKDNRLGFCDVQPLDECGFPVGRCRRYWRIDSTWYKSKKKFLEALANVEL